MSITIIYVYFLKDIDEFLLYYFLWYQCIYYDIVINIIICLFQLLMEKQNGPY